ncbi:MAG: hypothetical protein JW841_02365 [Deltaproteobacteria bacterium]|nr:hypothetical protein [Deltaproteobacteria bacterium]
MYDQLNWYISQDENFTLVSLEGIISENVDFRPLIENLADKSRVRFDLSGVNHINSWGVREWVNFIRTISHCDIELEKCSPAVVTYLNMISNFAEKARILSVQAPYICESCGNEENILILITPGIIPEVSEVDCGSCGGKMEFDDIISSYFAFVYNKDFTSI